MHICVYIFLEIKKRKQINIKISNQRVVHILVYFLLILNYLFVPVILPNDCLGLCLSCTCMLSMLCTIFAYVTSKGLVNILLHRLLLLGTSPYLSSGPTTLLNEIIGCKMLVNEMLGNWPVDTCFITWFIS